MISRFLLVATLCSACGGPDLDTSALTYCSVDGVNVTLEYRTNCAAIARNVATARHALIKAGLFDEASFGALFAEVEVVVKPETDLGCIDEECSAKAWGYYRTKLNRIELTCEMQSTLHEMLHAHDWHAGEGRVALEHLHWPARGYDDLDHAFKEEVVGGCY